MSLDKLEQNTLRFTFQSTVHEALDVMQQNFAGYAQSNPSLAHYRPTQGSLQVEFDCDAMSKKWVGTKHEKSLQEVAAALREEIAEELEWFPQVELVSVTGPQ